MKIAYHMPSLDTIYAGRYVYNGYKNACEDMGETFLTFTAGMDLNDFLTTHRPDIFITGSHFFWRKQLDFNVLKKYRQKGMAVVTKIDFWTSPIEKSRINEAQSMSHDPTLRSLIRRGLLGDVFMHVVEQDDERMNGFHDFYPKGYITIPLAADMVMMKESYKKKFASDVAFIGTNLPQKRKYFKEWLLPLGENYDLRLYGQDWSFSNRMAGNAQRIGQYFNLPYLKNLRKPPLEPQDEPAIYSSAKVLVNIHEEYQRVFGGDCNERTFKIPACGGFEITDDVKCIHKYFKADEEIVIAGSKEEWFSKIDYYIKNPDKAKIIAEKGKKRVLKDHTYHQRMKSIITHINTL